MDESAQRRRECADPAARWASQTALWVEEWLAPTGRVLEMLDPAVRRFRPGQAGQHRAGPRGGAAVRS